MQNPDVGDAAVPISPSLQHAQHATQHGAAADRDTPPATRARPLAALTAKEPRGENWSLWELWARC